MIKIITIVKIFTSFQFCAYPTVYGYTVTIYGSMVFLLDIKKIYTKNTNIKKIISFFFFLYIIVTKVTVTILTVEL